MFGSVLKWLTQPSPERENYRNSKEAFLALVGYSIGLGNFWRFPYLCYVHGGATFIIAYVVCMVCVGMPMNLLEQSLGQYVGLGPTHIFPYMFPILGGIGWGMTMIRVMICVYYNVILSWSLFYAGASFISPLPWSHCLDLPKGGDCSRKSVELSYRAAEDYFEHDVLGKPEGDESPYEMHWWLVLCLGLSWGLVCVCLFQGIRHAGKILHVTVTYPYVVLICLFALNYDEINKKAKNQWLQNLTTIELDKFFKPKLWSAAASQVIYSLGVGFGGVSMIASHNKLTHNVIRDTFLLCLLDVLTSVLCGNVLFSLAGSLSPDMISDNNGFSQLVFTLFSALFARITSSLWSFLFFVMIFSLGFDSLLFMVEAVTTTLLDQFSNFRRYYLLVIFSTCFTLFLLGLPMCTRGGFFFFDLMNEYTAKHSLFFVALLEVVITSYFYGHQNVLKFMKKYFKVRVPRPLRWYLAATWRVITPVCLLLLFVGSLYNEDWMSEKTKTLSFICGQAIAFAPILVIPGYALYAYYTKGTKMAPRSPSGFACLLWGVWLA
ncbi:sodium- and chloride-dependent glycine transporter 2-like isoform X2 [Eriocheir sinensis]|uniref:sodium- and chloride-dependent glycine transporter 2-like isoform X2 n=1 Tax=Eriocheir sinensis TaxID=95602 RepID=UPI0021C7A15F|nr:sodium- and chloride-dependent glycine transporter 2-like isoform X2 [Eriocheir sinensis]